MSINSRNKGKAGELELSNLLKEHGFKTRRGQQYSGASGDADVIGLPSLHIECKRVERLQLDKAMEQSKADCEEGSIPTVMHRKNYQEWLVTMRLEDFLEIYKQSEFSHENEI